MLFILGASGPARAAITAKLIGTTATQAILAYDAPDGAPCTVQVSEDSSMSLLVHDVNATLFAGANQDNRAGGLFNGTSRVVVIGRRAAEKAADGKNYSRALQTNTRHYYRLTCNGDSASGTFLTMNIPLNNTYNDPLAADPLTPGQYAWPTLDLSNKNQSVIDPQTGILIKPFKVNADGSFVGWFSAPGPLCATQTVTDNQGDQGQVCAFDTFLMFVSLGSGQTRIIGDTGLFMGSYADDVDPNSRHFLDGSRGLGWVEPTRWTYHGDYSAFSGALPNCATGSSPCYTRTSESTKTTIELMREATPSWFTALNIRAFGFQNGRWFLEAVRGSQDSHGFLAVYDVAQAKLIAITGTLKNPNGPARWCTIHSDSMSEDGWITLGSNDMHYENDTRPGYGAHTSNIVSGVLDANYIDCPPNAFGATGRWCSVVTVDREPRNDNPQAGEPAYVQDIQVGDFIGIDLNVVGFNETMRLVAKNGLTWTLQRVYGSNNGQWVNVHTSKKLYAMCGNHNNNVYGGLLHWNYLADPTGANVGGNGWIVEPAFASHNTNANDYTVFPFYDIRRGTAQQMWARPSADYTVEGNPSFAGIKGVGNPMNTDTHPAPPINGILLDGHPINGAQNGYTLNPADAMGGSLYRFTSNAYGGYAQAAWTHLTWDPKRAPVYAYCGANPLVDISGPASTISGGAGDNYKYCIARKTGECAAGSKVGDVYANCPNVTKAYCWGAGDQGDMCLGQFGSRYGALVQTDVSRADTLGVNSRVLTHGLGQYKPQDVYWNTVPVGNGSWFVFNIPKPNGTANQQVYMGKLPPFPANDGVPRNGYLPVPVPVTTPMAGTNNVVVQFGYGENGTISQFFCTSRQEACVKGSQSGDQFDYASDSVPGVPCSNGCTVTVPALPQRVVYVQTLYRDSGNNVIGRSPIRVVTSEPPYTLSDMTPPPSLPPSLSLDKSLLSFEAGLQSGNPPGQIVVVTNGGGTGSSLNWTSRPSASWITMSPINGIMGSGNRNPVSVSASLSGLMPGSYQGSIVFEDPNAPNSPKTLTIALSVAPGLSAASALASGVLVPKVYPNPWRSDRHTGDITFANLSPGATVKIFTISGHLVRDLSVSGTSVPWDRRNDKGDAVASGIYIYLIEDVHGNQAKGKLAVIK